MMTTWMPFQAAGLSSALIKAKVLNSKDASEDFRNGISISRRIRNDTSKRNYSGMVLQRIYLEQSLAFCRYQFISYNLLYSLVDRSHSFV
jgi:hypothetical protein